jgi:plasmid stability protein
MASMSIRNIPEGDLEALKRIAAENNRSAEAEVRQAIAEHVRSKGKGFGTYLHERYGGLLPADFLAGREKTPAEPMKIE